RVAREGRHHGDVLARAQVLQEPGVHGLDVTRGAGVHGPGLEQARVHAAQAHAGHARGLQVRQQVRAQPAGDGRAGVEGRVQLRARAVHHHGLDGEGPQQADLLAGRAPQLRIADDGAVEQHHERLAAELPDVAGRGAQRGVGIGREGHGGPRGASGRQQPGEDGALDVEAVLRPVDDAAGRVVQHVVGDLDVAAHGQAVEEERVRGGLLQGLARGHPVRVRGQQRGDISGGVRGARGGPPGLGVDGVAASQGLGLIMGVGDAAAGGLRVGLGLGAHLRVQLEAGRVGHPHLAARRRRGEQEGVGHRLGERLDVRRPGERHRQLLRGAEVLAQREHVREPLAGVLSRGLHADQGHGDVAPEGGDDGIHLVLLIVPTGREGAHPEHVHEARQDGRGLLDVLGAVSIHHRPGPVLQLPHTAAHIHDDGIAASAQHHRLERGARAQRGVEEHHAQNAAEEQGLGSLALPGGGLREDRLDAFRTEVPDVGQVLHGRLLAVPLGGGEMSLHMHA
ncbi:hypothetical protein STIAU_0998, partial [Stigmatella aurantiaca DW4/3-1]